MFIAMPPNEENIEDKAARVIQKGININVVV